MREVPVPPEARRRTLLLFAASLIIAIALAVALRHFSGVRLERAPPRPADVGKPRGFDPVTVDRQEALIRRPVTGHTWLVYWGGTSARDFPEAVATIEGLKLPADIGVLIVAPKGFDPEGRPSPPELEQAATNTRQWLRREEQAKRIVTGGFSLGSYSALVAAERDVVGTFILGASPVFQANEPGLLMRLRVPDSFRLKAAPPKVPAIVIQGGLDEVEHGRSVAKWLGARFVVVPGVSHTETQRNAVALRAARDFVEEALERP